MKVPATPKINYDISCPKNDLLNCSTSFGNGIPKDSVSFGSSGNVKDVFKGGATGLFKFIANNGFFMEFLIVDSVSMIIPRIIVGLNRDKEKTGKTNYQAGMEEAGREILSGPSMNLIPMGILALVTKVLPASHMSKGALSDFTEKMTEIVKGAGTVKDKEALNKALADKLFDSAFEKFDFGSKGMYNKYKTEFNKLLNESTKLEPRSKFGKLKDKLCKADAAPFEAAQEKFKQHVSLINNKNLKAQPLDTGSVNGSPAGELFEDFRHYSKDITEKLVNTAGDAGEFLRQAKSKRMNVKILSALTAFVAVGSFLLYLPKVYQQGSISPAAASAERAKAEAAKGGANEN